MPKIVDHERRRQTLAATAVAVIADSGLENATLRDIASEAGFSTGIVSHYFRNKDELMLSALEHVEAQVAQRFEQRRDRSLRKALESILPLDRQRRAEWRVRINFWGRAMIQPDLAQKLAQSQSRSQRALEAIVRQEAERGRLPRGKSAAVVAEALMDRTLSLSLRILFQPADYPRRRVLDALERSLGEFGLNGAILSGESK